METQEKMKYGYLQFLRGKPLVREIERIINTWVPMGEHIANGERRVLWLSPAQVVKKTMKVPTAKPYIRPLSLPGKAPGDLPSARPSGHTGDCHVLVC